MSRAIDSTRSFILPCICSRLFIVVGSLTILFFTAFEIVVIARRHSSVNEPSSSSGAQTTKSPLTEIAKDVFLVHTIRDRRNQGEEIRALVYAKAPNYNVECGMKNGIRMRASWYEISDNGNSLWRAYYLSCNLPDVFFEDMLVESLGFVEHLPNAEAPRLGFRITGADVNYDVSYIDPPEFEIFFGLCASLLKADEFTAQDVVEFIELNRILGAEKITFVVRRDAIKREVIAALKHYSIDPLVELVDFELPFPSAEVGNNGANVARDICLHRHMQTTEFVKFFMEAFCRFRFVGFTTLREFFLPLENATMTDALWDFPYYESGLIKISVLEVPMRSDARPLTMSNKFRTNTLEHKATRGIIRPRKVVEMGPHFAYHLINSGRAVVFENNARHIVLYRLTFVSTAPEDTVTMSTVAERSISDIAPVLANAYERISKSIEEIYSRLATH